MARLPRGQAWILVLFVAFALLGAVLVGAFKTFERGVGAGAVVWALFVLVGLLGGSAAYHWLRSTQHPQQP